MAGYIIQNYVVCKVLLHFSEGYLGEEASCSKVKARASV